MFHSLKTLLTCILSCRVLISNFRVKGKMKYSQYNCCIDPQKTPGINEIGTTFKWLDMK